MSSTQLPRGVLQMAKFLILESWNQIHECQDTQKCENNCTKKIRMQAKYACNIKARGSQTLESRQASRQSNSFPSTIALIQSAEEKNTAIRYIHYKIFKRSLKCYFHYIRSGITSLDVFIGNFKSQFIHKRIRHVPQTLC